MSSINGNGKHMCPSWSEEDKVCLVHGKLTHVDPADYDPTYADYKERRDDFDTLLKQIGTVPEADDLNQRIRQLGAALVGLENPCVAVVSNPRSDEETRALANKVLGVVDKLANQIAELLVDLSQTQQLVTILNGSPS